MLYRLIPRFDGLQTDIGWQLAWHMLAHNRSRLIITILGVSMAFLLAATQFGLLVGWINTTTALIRHAEVDLWVMAEQTAVWDFGIPISRQYIYQAKSVPGVTWAQGLLVSSGMWHRSDGQNVNITLVGLDADKVGGPWQMHTGTLNYLDKPKTVIIDELYRDILQIQSVGSNAQLFDRQTVVGGFSKGVRTFTASPHVFASIKQAIRYDGHYTDQDITYVLVRCQPGMDVKRVQNTMRQHMRFVDILTANEFIVRSARYWMLETGAGFTVIIMAVASLLVGTAITSQALFNITREHLNNYTTLLAIGFSRKLLVRVVVFQSLLINLLGVSLGTLLLLPIIKATARCPMPVEFSIPVLSALIALFLLCCLLASSSALRSVFHLDPVIVFSQQ